MNRLPRITMSIIKQHGGVVLWLRDGREFTTPGGRHLRRDSVNVLINLGRLQSQEDGLLPGMPQTYRLK